jgi:hypothetical protein
MRDVAGGDQGHRKAARLKHLTQRHPVEARRCHHDGGHPTGRSPVGEPMQVTGKRATCLDRLGSTIGGHTDPVLLSPHITAGGMRMDDGHMCGRGLVLLAFFGHTCRQSGAERGEHGKRGGVLRQDIMGGSAWHAARLFHLDRINAQRWRDANVALEATGHSVRFFPARVSVPVARASARALGVKLNYGYHHDQVGLGLSWTRCGVL